MRLNLAMEEMLGQFRIDPEKPPSLAAAHGSFQIVVAADTDSPADCTVRFYKRRSGEVWIEDDLEGYAHEGILVIETPELDRAPTYVH